VVIFVLILVATTVYLEIPMLQIPLFCGPRAQGMYDFGVVARKQERERLAQEYWRAVVIGFKLVTLTSQVVPQHLSLFLLLCVHF
jgi:hypothetical protein